MKIEINIELPKEILTLISSINEFLRLEYMSECYCQESNDLKKSEKPKKSEETEKSKKIEKPKELTGATFAKLPFEDMIPLIRDSKEFSPFRFRAFAKCARDKYGNAIMDIVNSVNSGGINEIIEKKLRKQAEKCIMEIIEFAETFNRECG